MPGLLHARARPRAALLDDGRVLVSGGEVWDGRAHRLVTVETDEVLDPWTLAASPAPDGARARMLRFDAGLRRFVPLAELPAPRPVTEARGALALPDGKTLHAGGEVEVDTGRFGLRPEASAVLTRGRGRAGKLAHARSRPTLSWLLDGRVLVSGGYAIGMDYSWEDTQDPVAPCELVDLERTRTEVARPLAVPRWGHAAVLLPDGAVLIVGGERPFSMGIADVERWMR